MGPNPKKHGNSHMHIVCRYGCFCELGSMGVPWPGCPDEKISALLGSIFGHLILGMLLYGCFHKRGLHVGPTILGFILRPLIFGSSHMHVVCGYMSPLPVRNSQNHCQRFSAASAFPFGAREEYEAATCCF